MNRLKELRKNCNLTQKEVAKAISVSPQSYGYYENWINKPDPDTLIKLADVFHVSIDYLLGREDDFGNVVSKENNGSELSPAEWDFIRKMRTLDPRHLKVLELQLETLSELQLESSKK